MENRMELIIAATSLNESFARATVGAFTAQLDPDIETLSDIKTAVSEAVTNAIVHGYDSDNEKDVVLKCAISDGTVTITVEDGGQGMSDPEKCQEDGFTTAADDERSGFGYTIMKSLMDEVNVKSEVGRGTVVTMKKKIR